MPKRSLTPSPPWAPPSWSVPYRRLLGGTGRTQEYPPHAAIPQNPAEITGICCAQGQSRTVYTRIFSAGNMREIIEKIEYSCLSVP